MKSPGREQTAARDATIANERSAPASSRRERMALAAVLAVFTAALAWSAWVHSPVVDEPAHLVAGLSYWQLGRFDLYRVNPPLVKMIAALPAWCTGRHAAFSQAAFEPGVRGEWELGAAYLQQYRETGFRMVIWGRWCCLPFALVGAVACYVWATRMYGCWSGWLALLLWCCSPCVLGHGSLLTTDVPAAAMMVLAGYRFWRWWCEPQMWNASLLGAAFGVALLVKTTTLVLAICWLALYLLHYLFKSKLDADRFVRQELVGVASAMLMVLYTVNAGYGFEGTGTRLGDYQFTSRALSGKNSSARKMPVAGNRWKESWLAPMPIPLPRNFVLGLDEQRRDLEGGPTSYLRGEVRHRGWWYWYLYAAAIKVPLGEWGLFFLAVFVTVLCRSYSRDIWSEGMLLLPAVAVLTAASAQPGLTDHFRYVFPSLPFMFVWTSKLARAIEVRQVRVAVAGGLCVAWFIGSVLAVYPHCLSYFNELVGGARGGGAHLIRSNLDWGQDLWFLKQWQERHQNARPFYLEYYGPVDPRVADLDHEPLPPGVPLRDEDREQVRAGQWGPQAGWCAISETSLRTRGVYSYLQRFTPKETVGYSIRIYNLSSQEVNQLRRELGFPELIRVAREANRPTKSSL